MTNTPRMFARTDAATQCERSEEVRAQFATPALPTLPSLPNHPKNMSDSPSIHRHVSGRADGQS